MNIKKRAISLVIVILLVLSTGVAQVSTYADSFEITMGMSYSDVVAALNNPLYDEVVVKTSLGLFFPSGGITIPAGKTLTIPAGVRLEDFIAPCVFVNYGTINVAGEVDAHHPDGSYTNHGVINIAPTGKLGSFYSVAPITNEAGGIINNEGLLKTDTGVFTNDGTYVGSGTLSFDTFAGTNTTQYTITFDENYSGGSTDTISLYAASMDSFMPNDPSRSGDVFLGWNTAQDGTGTTFDDSTALSTLGGTTATVYAKWQSNTPSLGSGSSDDDNDDSGSSSRVTRTPAAPKVSEYIIDKAGMQKLITAAKDSGASVVRASSDLPTTVKTEAWALLTDRFSARTVSGKAVQVQLTIPQPNKIAADMKVSGWVSGSAVDSCKATFEKWFKNKVRVIHLEHSGSFDQPVEIAAKVDLTGMDTNKLYFYSYDKSGNRYVRIQQPNNWIDENGFLHFTTTLGGEIVISEGALEQK